MKFTKNYTLPYPNGEKEIEVIVNVGFDENLLINHPKEFEEGEKEKFLFMFIDVNSDESWFENNYNDNNYITVLKIKTDEITREKLENIIDLIYDKQKEALSNLNQNL